jgi:hypothetical protein
MHGSQEGESCTPRKACNSSSYNKSGLFVVVFLSVGHYAYYGGPDFSITKSFSALVFPPRVYTQNFWCSCVIDLISLFMLSMHV